MPIYTTENVAIVLDIGSVFTKFGFIDEPSPRLIYRSQVKYQGEVRDLLSYKDKNELHFMLIEYFNDVYFKHALMTPKDRLMVVVESLFCPIEFRETLAKVLFIHFGASSLLLLSSHLVSLSTLPVDTGLVLDIGYKEASCVPICFGMPLVQAWQRLDLGSSAVHKNLKELLVEKDPSAAQLSEWNLEDITVRCCFVTKKSRAAEFLLPKPKIDPCPDVKYPLEGSSSLNISGSIREKAYEVLFEGDIDDSCIPTLILDALLSVNMDLRNLLAENILLIGGTSMAYGIKSRLREELLERVNDPKYNKMKIKSFKFHSSPSKENYTAWLGGAIYGGTDWLKGKATTREEFLKEKKLPDWCDLKNNYGKVWKGK